MGNIYSAQNDDRTTLLMKGLDDIVEKINPRDTGHWEQVKSDSRRLLMVWKACEDDNVDTPGIMMSQIMESIEEFSGGIPELLITEAPAPAPAPAIQHIPQKAVFQSPVLRAAPPPVQVNPEHTVVVLHKEGSVEEEIEEEEEEEEFEMEEAEEEVEEEEEEEVIEPEEEQVEEAEEEEGMEVEKFMHRGRNYWIDTKTKKLYAIEGEDDVGDEVGIVINGKPVFVAAAA